MQVPLLVHQRKEEVSAGGWPLLFPLTGSMQEGGFFSSL